MEANNFLENDLEVTNKSSFIQQCCYNLNELIIQTMLQNSVQNEKYFNNTKNQNFLLKLNVSNFYNNGDNNSNNIKNLNVLKNVFRKKLQF